MQLTRSLKAHGFGFNPRTYEVKTWFQSLLSKLILCRYGTVSFSFKVPLSGGGGGGGGGGGSSSSSSSSTGVGGGGGGGKDGKDEHPHRFWDHLPGLHGSNVPPSKGGAGGGGGGGAEAGGGTLVLPVDEGVPTQSQTTAAAASSDPRRAEVEDMRVSGGRLADQMRAIAAVGTPYKSNAVDP
jgi:hypothetical protein